MPIVQVKPTEKPVEAPKPTEKPVEDVKPTEKPVEEVKPTEKPVEEVKPTEKPVEEVKPTEKPVEDVKPTDKPVEDKAEAPTDNAVAPPENANDSPVVDNGKSRQLTNDEQCQSAFAYCPGNNAALPLCDKAEPSSQVEPVSPWGWSNLLQSPDAVMECTLYVGALECDIEKATPVGTVTIDSSRNEVLYRLNDDSQWILSQLSLYVGHEEFPWVASASATVPMAYPIQKHLDHQSLLKSATILVEESSRLQSGRFVVAHANVCNNGPPATVAIAAE